MNAIPSSVAFSFVALVTGQAPTATGLKIVSVIATDYCIHAAPAVYQVMIPASPPTLYDHPAIQTGYPYGLEDMKRSLDTSSLPVNPMTGMAATITLDQSPLGAGKKPRYESQMTGSVPTSPFVPMVGAGAMMDMYPALGMPYLPLSPRIGQPMNPATMTGNYGPAAAAAAAAAAGNQTGRTVYVGNLPADASVDELLNLVRFGPIESVRLLPEKSCVFISFLDGSTAAAFHADASVKKLALHGQELKIGWGKPSLVPAIVAHAIHQAAATRNVYVGSLDSALTEQELRDDLGRFGPIDQVKIVRDKNIGFVHFLSIATAMKVVATLPTEPAWAGKRVNYGKDRCAYVPKAQQAAVQAAQAQAAAAISSQTPFTPFTSPFSYPSPPAFHPFDNQAGNRCVYLGGIHHEATVEDLCNAIRGGMLQQIRYLADKHIAFVTFIDPGHALAFHQNATFNGLSISQRRVKVGWGKHSGTIHPATAMAVQAGASRNVYVGAITDFDTFTDDKLRRDFGEYGDIELVNFLKEKNAAFVNFCSITNAQKAIEGMKSKPEYAGLRISYGKDRCANPPRTGAPRAVPKDDVAAAIAAAEASAPPLPAGLADPIDEDFEDGFYHQRSELDDMSE